MSLKEIFFPKFCLGCGCLGAYICNKCQNKLYYNQNDACLYCQRKSLWGLTHISCRRPLGIDQVTNIFYYNNLLKKIIKSLKYRLATDVWKELCLVIKPAALEKLGLYKKLFSRHRWVYIEPIPLHQSRLRQRGFNQAQIIAEFFDDFLSFPVSHFLKRTKETAYQAVIKQNKKRYLNLRGAFVLRDNTSVKNKNFILVDDVITSGSTIKEAARILKISGAGMVCALTLAKG